MTTHSYDDVCMIVGLEKAPELNGRAVRVCLPIGPIGDPDRVPCELLIGAKKLAVRSKNLFPVKDDDALRSERVRALMPQDDFNDAALLLYSKRGSEVVAPGVIRMRTSSSHSPPVPPSKRERSNPARSANVAKVANVASDAPMTEEEKAEALRIGQWGDRTSAFEWGEFVRSIKTARGGDGCYPSDWYEQMIVGRLFSEHGHATRSGF